jgi:predicted signal transduction protein with EAL and GGDEF domain
MARVSDTDEPMARMGGDEFIVLLDQVDDAGKASRVAQRILNKMSGSYELDGREIFITSSIGIALYPNDGNNDDDLLKNVHTAVYHAKKEGKNNYQFYSEAMNETAIEIMTMETNLRRALEQQEFLVYYQPKVDLQTRKITGMEALIRWKTHEGDMISPAKFIPIAEANGLIVPIDNFVMRTACLQNKKWHETGNGKVSVAVNISGSHFGQEDFVQDIFAILQDTNLDPNYLELEVTETTVMTDPEEAIRNLNRMKEAGIRVSLDDFGTGYSSLNYLQRLPLDAMKIDVSFIRNVLSNPNDAAIVKTIIAMAHNLNLKVVAEGVEDEQQLNFLEEHQCDSIQGYFFSPPVPAEKFEELLRAEV